MSKPVSIWLKRSIALLLVLAGGFGLSTSASAHPADINFHNYEITLTPGQIEITWGILPGPLMTEVLWGEADANADREVSPEEAILWANNGLEQITLSQDGQVIPLTIDKIVWPDNLQHLLVGDQPVLVFLSGQWAAPLNQPAPFEFSNQAPNSLHWYKVEAQDELVFSTPLQEGSRLSFDLTSQLPESSEEPNKWIDHWESGQPEIPGMVTSFGLGELAQQAASQSNRQQGVIGILEGLILNNETSPAFLVSAFGLALLLGALHALSPGHGKTVVAAYLVGASGKFYHAIALGSIVTLTHTGSVFALGLATLAASSYFMPANVFPLLEILSGLLILILGIGLLIPRLRDWAKKRRLDREAEAPRSTEPERPEDGPARLVLNQPITEIGPVHSHSPESGDFIPRSPSVGNPLKGITWRSLLTLGVSGGLVPCPDAIAILLIAVTINRISFGLSLIVAFSLGLAVVLITIGLLIVEGRQLFERLRWFDRVAYVMPVVSAVIVLGLGAVLTIGAAGKLPPGVLKFGSSSAAPSWEEMRVIYIKPDENYRFQLFTVPARGGEPTQITSYPEGVSGFSIGPDGSSVAYAASEEVLESSLWLWDQENGEHRLLLDCAPDFCKTPIWSPDSSQLIYERLPDPADPNALGISSIWWLELATGETRPVFQDASFPAFSPSWSPRGEWLSYSSINPNQVRFFNLSSSESRAVPLESNPQAVWHPTENLALYTKYSEIGDDYLTKLYLYDLDADEVTQISGELFLDENLPSWSSDGSQIAMTRRSWQGGEAAIGDQVWLYHVEDSTFRQLTFQEGIIHGAADWSPDGKALLYHVYDLNVGGNPDQIHILVIETGEEIILTNAGNSPKWLP